MITFRLKKPPQIVEMAANGQLVFTDVDKVTFKGVGDTSNAVIDTTTGKIGVGVDSPDANLHVLGNCFVSTNFELGGTMTMGTVTVRAQHELSAITATGNTTPHTVEFQNAETGLVTTGNVSVGKELTVTGNVAVDTDTLFVDSVNDRVGVGTTNPDCRLHVEEPADISATTRLFHTENGFSGGSVGHFEIVEKKTGTGTNWSDFTLRLQRRVDVTEQGYIEFNPTGSTGDYGIAFGSGTDEIMRIDGVNDRVGVGVATPLRTLEVQGSGQTQYGGLIHARLDDPGSAPYESNAFSMSMGGYTHSTRMDLNTLSLNAFGDVGRYGRMKFVVGDNTASGSGQVDAMTIEAGGNVGIGTTSPGSTLDVHGTGIHINGTVLRAMSAIGTVASGTYIKLCDFSALPATTSGVCAIRVRWGTGTGTGTYYYWQGHATGIVGYNTYSDGNGTFNGSGVEPLTLNHHYHYRTVGALSFRIDSDASGTSYGRHSIYMAPNASIDSMSFEVIAMPLRR